MIHLPTLLAILCVAFTTYLTRILGYVLLKNKTLTNRQRKILEVVPGCFYFMERSRNEEFPVFRMIKNTNIS